MVPGSSGANQADLVVEPRAADVETDVELLQRQFDTPDALQRSPLQHPELEITFVELNGGWMRPGTRWFVPDQTLLAAIIEEPAVRIVLGGQRETVAANREAFRRLLTHIHSTD